MEHYKELQERYTSLFVEAEKSKQLTVKGFKSPHPGNLPKAGAKLLANVYADYRKKKFSKERASKAAWGAVRSAGYKKNEVKETMESEPFVGKVPERPMTVRQSKKRKPYQKFMTVKV